MVVGVISGSESTGKTSQMLGIAKEFPQAVYGILELKDEKKIMKQENSDFTPEKLYRVYLDGHKFQGNVDPVATLQAVEEWRDAIYKSNPRPQTIVLDGISDLRGFAEDAYILADNVVRNSKGQAPRKNVGLQNLQGWMEINNTVKAILNPLINLALQNDINLLMSAQMKDNYINGQIIGQIPDYKNWIAYPVPCLFQLSYNENGYAVKCIKEPTNPRWRAENIPRETGLLDALREHNLIDKAQPEFVMQYDYDGKRLREYMKADNGADAEAKFYAKHPDAILVEVLK